jgi:hypothetical protein
MCPSEATCLSADCFLSEVAIVKIAELALNNNHSLTQSEITGLVS